MQKIVRMARSAGFKVNAAKASATGALLVVGAQAHAALPTALTAALTEIETNIGLLETALWGVVLLGTLMFFYIKMAKRGINKV